MNSFADLQQLTQPDNPADGLISSEEWQQLGELYALSGRELKVAEMMFAGLNREQIALELRKPDGTCLSSNTVRVYTDRLLRKLNVADPTQMAIRLLRVQRLLQRK